VSNRDDFTEKTKRALAMRAGWHCSFTKCGKLTVGPSEEGSDKVTMIGKAAHIRGAAPGSGSRRYDASMTQDERRSISNGIWLCADHADLIDDDEVTYTVDRLRQMKREHETNCDRAVRTGKSTEIVSGLLGIGPDIVCTGSLLHIDATSWTLRLSHFLIGDMHKLISYISGFAGQAADRKYVTSNELGDGRELMAAPSLTPDVDGHKLICPVAPSFPRVDVQNIGSAFAIHPDTNDMYLDQKRNIARVSGPDYFPQRVREVLSLQQGESPFFPTFGMRFFEYFEAFRGSPWFDLMLKLDVVRQTSISTPVNQTGERRTPLQCVTRVRNVELLSDTPIENRLPVRVDFEVQGLGQWQREISVYMPTAEQMAESAKKWRQCPGCQIRGMSDRGVLAGILDKIGYQE
jgi:hypothetical protein